MSIGIKTLGGLLLPRQLECPELDQSLSRAQTLKTTLAGNPVIYARQLAYRPLTLIAREGVAWFSRQQTDALLAMAATPDGQFELDWDGRRWLVLFRHHDPPAASFTPVYPFADRLFGEIRLLASGDTNSKK